MVGITPCYRITLENGSYGVETYINADSKIQITFEDGNTLIGYIECVEYGTYSDENDTLVIRGENGELYILLENRIKDRGKARKRGCKGSGKAVCKGKHLAGKVSPRRKAYRLSDFVKEIDKEQIGGI